MSNQLTNSDSLYLKSHSSNPVHWQTWSDQAFEMAKAENKPVLVSIGYSSCHWCHVMERESFSDDYIAGLMNKNFVCIKVDREEHPHVDQMYMETAQMFNGHGGWPLNVFCLPDGKPFFAGTYFPPKDNGHGIVPWPQLLMRIAEHFKRSPEELQENAENVVHNLIHANNPGQGKPIPFHKNALIGLAKGLCQGHDDQWGGFSKQPKFPPHLILEFLLTYRATGAAESDITAYERINEVIEKSLSGVLHGAIFDQLGGGFMRYCVDEYWLVPHFEKMLYDNGSLLSVIAKAYLGERNPLYKAVIEETVNWLNNEMLVEGTRAYASAVDADSEGKEGDYYAWNPEQLEAILGAKDAKAFSSLYNITQEGTFEEGKSIPALVSGDFDERQNAAPLRKKLLQSRSQRVAPKRDPKILVFWNALLAQGLVDAGLALGNAEYINQARELIDWIWDNLRDSSGHLGSHFYTQSGAQGAGFLDDYAAYALACLNLARGIDSYDFGASAQYIERAQELAQHIETLFADPEHPGYFFSQEDTDGPLIRKKYWMDTATPSGNGMLFHVFGQLHALTGDSKYKDRFDRLLEGFGPLAVKAGSAVTFAMAGITQEAMGIPVVKVQTQEGLAALELAMRSKRYRHAFTLASQDSGAKELYQLCIGSQCLPGTEDFEDVVEKI